MVALGLVTPEQAEGELLLGTQRHLLVFLTPHTSLSHPPDTPTPPDPP